MGILDISIGKIDKEVGARLENCIYNRLPNLQQQGEHELDKLLPAGGGKVEWSSIIIQNSIVLNVVDLKDIVDVFNPNLGRTEKISVFSASLIATINASFKEAIGAYMREKRCALQCLLQWHAELLVFVFDGQHVSAEEQIIIQSHIEGFGEVLLGFAEELKQTIV